MRKRSATGCNVSSSWLTVRTRRDDALRSRRLRLGGSACSTYVRLPAGDCSQGLSRSKGELMVRCSPFRPATWRSLCNPERIRVLIGTQGLGSTCAATSAYVSSEKKAASIAVRSSDVRTASARSAVAWALLLGTPSTSPGSVVPVVRAQQIPGVRGLEALLALLEPEPVDGARARLDHDPLPKDGPVRPPGSVRRSARRRGRCKRVTYAAVSRLAVMRRTNVKTGRWARSYNACRAS